ncbi:MAG: ORF6N domain-containing protein [Kiritimatiellia bacterium]
MKYPTTADVERFREAILTIRGVPVILDTDLALAYGVTTKALNQAVKRNQERFPCEFVLLLSQKDVINLKSHFVTSSSRYEQPPKETASNHGGRRKPAYAFTEHGAIMAAMVLNSPKAVQMSVYVVRAFVAMRSLLVSQQGLAKKLAELERTLTERLDTHEHAISDIIQQIMQLLTPPPPEPETARPRIGFGVRERRARYRVRCECRRQEGGRKA